MSNFTYKALPLRLIGTAAFREASREELCVLLALIELDGACSEDELAGGAGVSVARCKAALSFWEESGIIKVDDGKPTVTEEFEERLLAGEIDERTSGEVARDIRNESLACMLDECAAMLGAATLTNADVKSLTALNTQYALSPEYIVTLAASMNRDGKLTVRRLVNEAIRLAGRGVENLEQLEAYISLCEKSSGADWEFRRVLGIYNRSLTKPEQERFNRWANEFGYSAAIVSEAYDIAIDCTSGNGVSAYMDKILAGWHEAGCKTVAECRAKRESDRLTRAESKSGTQKKAKTEAPKPRYGDFDIGDAFTKALARSYGEGDGTEED